MHVEKSNISETEIKIAIIATTEDLEPIKLRVLKLLSRNVKAPGFREGKVPLQLVEKYLDPNTVQTNFLDEAMSELYSKACTQEDVRPVTPPKVEIKKFVPFTTLEFSVTTSVIGRIKLGTYKGVKTAVKTKKVTVDDLSGVLATLQTRMSERKVVERPAKKDDEVVIDFSAVDDKNASISGADGKDYPLTIGSNSFIPGFEDSLIGLKAGDKKSFPLTFPKDYGSKALASKKVTFIVEVKTVNELVKPEITDEFAVQTGPFKNVQELKDDIKKQLEQEAENEALRAKQNDVVSQIVEKSTVAIPQELIDQQTVYEIDEIRRNLTYQGQTYQEFIESEQTTEEKYKKDFIEPRALEQVKTGILLSEIAEKENISVTPEELNIQIKALKDQYKDPAMQDELEKPESRRDIASRILSQKVVNFIVDKSV